MDVSMREGGEGVRTSGEGVSMREGGEGVRTSGEGVRMREGSEGVEVVWEGGKGVEAVRVDAGVEVTKMDDDSEGVRLGGGVGVEGV